MSRKVAQHLATHCPPSPGGSSSLRPCLPSYKSTALSVISPLPAYTITPSSLFVLRNISYLCHFSFLLFLLTSRTFCLPGCCRSLQLVPSVIPASAVRGCQIHHSRPPPAPHLLRTHGLHQAKPTPGPALQAACVWPLGPPASPHTSTPGFLSSAAGLPTAQHSSPAPSSFVLSARGPRPSGRLAPLRPPATSQSRPPESSWRRPRAHYLHCSRGADYTLPCNSSL